MSERTGTPAAEVSYPGGWWRWSDYWRKRSETQGLQYVGRKGQDFRLQQVRIESLLRTVLPAGARFSDGLDYGCGWGRLVPFWAEICDHVWAVDLVAEQSAQAGRRAPNVTALTAGWPLRLPFRVSRIDLLWVGHVFQHIVEDDIFFDVTRELNRVLAPGARVLVLDNAVDRAPHVKPRSPELLARGLGLIKGWTAEKVTVDERPQDHWFIQGVHG